MEASVGDTHECGEPRKPFRNRYPEPAAMFVGLNTSVTQVNLSHYLGVQGIRNDINTMIPKTLIAASVRPIILSILQDGESYGYAIIQRIHDLSGGRVQWSDGTLYPVLHRLAAEGLLEARWQASSPRRRKYYRLTRMGRSALAVERTQWLDVHAILAQLWGLEPQVSL